MKSVKNLTLIFALLCSNASFAENISDAEFDALRKRTQKLEQELNQLKKQIASGKHRQAKKKQHKYDDLPKISAYFAFDKTFYSNDSGNRPHNSELRFGRITLKHTIKHEHMPDLKVKVGADFARGDATIYDAFITLPINASNQISLGHMREPFSLNLLSSRVNDLFVDRPAAVKMSPARNIGIRYDHIKENYYASIGAFGDGVDDQQDADETFSYGARFVFNPDLFDKIKTHLGYAYRSSNPTGDSVSYVASEADIAAGENDLETGNINDVNTIRQDGIELAFVNPRFSMSSEYFITELSRDNASKIELYGTYVQFRVGLNKKLLNYNQQKRTIDLAKDSYNVFELGYRYSYVDFNHGDLRSGNYESHSFGLNYIYSHNLRFLSSYINIETDENSVYGKNSPEIVAFRAQFLF